jgi:hypothetical protein
MCEKIETLDISSAHILQQCAEIVSSESLTKCFFFRNGDKKVIVTQPNLSDRNWTEILLERNLGFKDLVTFLEVLLLWLFLEKERERGVKNVLSNSPSIKPFLSHFPSPLKI